MGCTQRQGAQPARIRLWTGSGAERGECGPKVAHPVRRPAWAPPRGSFPRQQRALGLRLRSPSPRPGRDDEGRGQGTGLSGTWICRVILEWKRLRRSVRVTGEGERTLVVLRFLP